MPTRTTYLVTLTDARPNDPEAGPLNVRLRRALKSLLRGFALKCTRVEEVPPAASPAPDAGDASVVRAEGVP